MRSLKLTQAQQKALQKQYKLGSDLSKQDAIVKIFNPYGRGYWYLLNQDPDDPDYLWAIVVLYQGEPEVGSVSLSELQSIKFSPYRLPLEVDRGFRKINAETLLEGLYEGKHFKSGGEIEVINATPEKYNKNRYKGIYGDFDKDGVKNVDDAEPTNKQDKGEVEQVKLTKVFDKVLATRAMLDKKIKSIVAELKKIAPPNSEIYYRTKTPYSMLNKLVNKKLYNPTPVKEGEIEGLSDLVGTTIVVNDVRQINDISKKIDDGLMGAILEKKDYYKNPKAGYRAIHYITLYDNEIPVEIQLKTKRQKSIGESSHSAYKDEQLDADFLLYLTKRADEADKGDVEAQKELDDLLKDKKALTQRFYKK